MQNNEPQLKIPDETNSSNVLDDLREMFKPILAKLSKDQRKTLAEIDNHIFPLHNSQQESQKLVDESLQIDKLPKKYIKSQKNELDNLFCIPLNHKPQSQPDKGEYDDELYY
jgi:hypothetical protein